MKLPLLGARHLDFLVRNLLGLVVACGQQGERQRDRQYSSGHGHLLLLDHPTLTRAAADLARATASSTFSPRARATPMRRFLSILGLAKMRRSTGLPGEPSASASAIP